MFSPTPRVPECPLGQPDAQCWADEAMESSQLRGGAWWADLCVCTCEAVQTKSVEPPSIAHELGRLCRCRRSDWGHRCFCWTSNRASMMYKLLFKHLQSAYSILPFSGRPHTCTGCACPMQPGALVKALQRQPAAVGPTARTGRRCCWLASLSEPTGI